MKKATIDVFVGFQGNSVRIAAGQEYADDHPLVVAYPGMFADVPTKKKPGRPLGSKNRPTSDHT